MADEAASRALLLNSGTAEAVTVNQRALIDKILARYAAEFTVFRELIQNSDDAGAEACELRFYSDGHQQSPSSQSIERAPDLNATLRSWVFRNNGKPFSNDDWNRLRRIAEGNPDPDRIGAFGVGFYSLFSISEEPIVSSGDQLMGFFWKEDSLFTRRASSASSNQSPSGQPWTTFHMPLREPAPFPDSFLDLSRFLATSLTFTGNVKRLSLYFDDHPLCRLSKVLEPSRALDMPVHLNTSSPRKMLRVTSLATTAMKLEVEAMRIVLDLAEKLKKPTMLNLASAFTKQSGGGGGLASMLQNAFGRSKKEEPVKTVPSSDAVAANDHLSKAARALTTSAATVHVRIVTATANVSVDRAFEREIERSTKKPPPKVTKLQIVAQNRQEFSASQAASVDGKSLLEGDMAEIFKGIMPSTEAQGHIFIGFKTSQTSSFAGHLAARFIPTVERESIDFIDRYCAQWNNELLASAGYVTRAVYEAELAQIGQDWAKEFGNSRPKDEDARKAQDLLDRALHVMRYFTFKASTPSSRVHTTLESAFFACARQNTLTLASSRGVKHSALVRFPNATLADFVKDLPVIPPAHVEQASEFVGVVKSRGLIRDISMEDVFSELSGRALSVAEMTSCLRWWISVASHPSYDPSLLRQLLNNALVEEAKDGQETNLQQLAGVKTYLNTHKIPTDVPLPPHCLIYSVSKSFTSADLYRTFDWLELSIPQWVQHIVTTSRAKDCAIDKSIQLSPVFAERIFGIVARSWGSMAVAQQEEVCAAFKECACMPTKKGMVKPSESYFANVSLFDDLPIVSLPGQASVRGNLEKLFAALGVRKHVDLQMIFDRLVAAGDWDVVQLVTYLAANKDSLTALERERLTKTAIFPKAGEVRSKNADGTSGRIARYRASQLYEPTDALQALGMPIIDWPGKAWRSNSDEAKFIFDLGLRRNPPLEEILRLCSTLNEDVALRKTALAYLLDKLPTVYKAAYSVKSAASFAFVPCQDKDGKVALVKPTEAFTNSEAAILGFATVSNDIGMLDVAKLGLRSNPTSAQVVSKLINEPVRDVAKARRVFEYLSSFPDFSHADYKLLSTASIIPVTKKSEIAPSDGKGTKGDIVLLARPIETFFSSTTTNDDQMRKVLNDIFTFVDFGERASTFLRNCGVTNEPSIDEVARQLVRDPLKFFRIAGVEAYLGLLRQISTNWTKMSYALRNEMKRSSFVLASKRVNVAAQQSKAAIAKPTTTNKSLLDDDDLDDDEDGDEQGVLIHDLKRPDEVVVVDDATSHMLFASVVFTSPHEDSIEIMLLELGAKKLSSLVEERYTAAGQVLFETPRCQEVQSVVNERAPLFIFEKRQTAKGEIKHDADWLKSRLTVAQVDGRGLRLTRQLRFGSINVSNEQSCSAMAAVGSANGQRDRLILYIAGNLETDWFEVAMAISKHLLSRQRLQEVLLFMTLLSTSLRNLKRRGFHVDKILTQRKADREAAERLMRDERAKAELEAARRPSEGQIKQWTRDMLAVFPDADPMYVEKLLREAKDDHVVQATNGMLERPYPKSQAIKRNPLLDGGMDSDRNALVTTAGKHDGTQQESTDRAGKSGTSGNGLFSNWRNRMRGADDSSSNGMPPLPGGWQPGQTKHPFPEALTAAIKASSAGQVADSIAGSVASGNTTSQATARNPNAGVTPSANIRRKVLSAIDASRGKAPSAFDSSIASQGHQTKVKEAQSTYCDTTGVAMNLRLAGQIASMNVYVSPELDPSQTLINNGTQMTAFIEMIVKPIIAIFNVDVNSVNVFVDVSGPSIAFNRGGSLFLNFRYHLIWFDDEVRQGNLTNALISTYHSLAHELAHNLVAQHDSEHEFWFSSICEQFFVPFAALVTQSQAQVVKSSQ